MRKGINLAVVVLLFAWCLGCATSKSLDGVTGGGGGGGTTAAFQAGNWAFTTSGGLNGTIYMGGYLSGTGTNVSGTLFVLGTTGSGFNFSNPMMPVTGTLTSNTLTLSGTVSSSNIVLTFTNVASGSTSVTGSYTVTGGTDNGDSGTVAGVIAGSYTGTWAGTEATTGGVVTVGMTEAAAPNTNDSFTLSPTSGSGVTFGNVTGCVVTGTLNSANSFVAGGIVYLDIATTDTGIPGEMKFLGVANDPTNATTLGTYGYFYNGGTSCMLQSGTSTNVAFTLVKQ